MDEFKKLTTEQQNENWNRCTPEFRNCVREIYERTPVNDEEYDTGVFDVLDHLYGEHNMSSYSEPKNMLMVEQDKLYDLIKEGNSNLHLSAGICHSINSLFGDYFIRIIPRQYNIKPKYEVGSVVGIKGVVGIYTIEEITSTPPFRYRMNGRLDYIYENDILLHFSKTPNSGELKLQSIMNKCFHVGDIVRVVKSPNSFIPAGEVGDVLDIDPQDKSCFVLFAKSQHWIDPANLEHYTKVEESVDLKRANTLSDESLDNIIFELIRIRSNRRSCYKDLADILSKLPNQPTSEDK